MSGSPTQASDWFSVGATLFYTVTGLRLPEITSRNDDVMPFLDVVAEEYREVIRSLINPHPDARGDGQQLLDALSTPESPAPDVHIAGAPTRHFVGRTAETTALLEHIVAHPTGSIGIIRGPSGIGKSELTRHVEAELGKDALAIHGRCRQNETIEYRALDPLIDGLARHLKRLPPDEALMLVPRFCGPMLVLFPLLRAVPAFRRAEQQNLVPDAFEQKRLGIQGLREVLVRLGDEQRLLFVVDDAQWGDADSVELLREIMKPPDPPPIHLLVSHRDTHQPSAFLTALAAELDLPRQDIELGALPGLTGTALVNELASGMGESATAAIVEAADGSPFLLTELARYASEGGTDAPTISLADMVAKRLDGLDAIARELVEVVALSHHGIDIATAQLLIPGFSWPIANDLCNRCWTRFVGDVDRLETYHDQIGEAVATLISPEDRASRHRRIGEALERSPEPRWGDITEHYLAGGAATDVSRCATLAAEDALESLAFWQAAQYFDTAIRHGADAESLKPRHAHALSMCGRYGPAGDLYVEIAEGSDNEKRADDMRIAAASEYMKGGDFTRAKRMLRDVLTKQLGAIPPSGKPLERWIVRNRLRLLYPLRRGLDERLLAREGYPEKPDAEADAYFNLAYLTGPLDAGLGGLLTVQGIKRALDHGSFPQIVGNLLFEPAKYVLFGHPFDWIAHRLQLEMLRVVRQSPDRKGRLHERACIGLSSLHHFQSRHRRSSAWMRRAEKRAARNRPDGWLDAYLNWFVLKNSAIIGDFEDLARRFADGFDDALNRHDLLGQANLLMSGGYVLWLLEDKAERALSRSEQIMAQMDQEICLVQHVHHCVSLASILLYLGRTEEAAERIPALHKKIEAGGLLEQGWLGVNTQAALAKTQLALAAADATRRVEALKAAELVARSLWRWNRSGSRAFATLVRGSIKAQRGDAKTAEASWRDAIDDLRRHDCDLMAETATLRLADLTKVSADVKAAEAVRHRWTASGAVSIDRFAQSLLPAVG